MAFMASESESHKACVVTLFGGSVIAESVSFGEVDMTAATFALSHRLRPLLAAIYLGTAGALVSVPAFARGPEGVADVAEKVIDAVVNISTSQTVEAKGGGGDGRGAIPQLPPGSPCAEFFDDCFKNRPGGGKGGGDLQQRKTS